MEGYSFTVASFPFDGTCRCSRNGDATLKFRDGFLITHSALLKMASPVFDSMLTDCTDTKTLVLENTSRKTWVHILNHLHPAGSLVFSNFDRDKGFAVELQEDHTYGTNKLKAKCDMLSDLLDQARKFQLDSLFIFMDDLLVSIFPKELTRNLAQIAVDVNRSHSRLYNLALQFEMKLPKTSERVRANIVKYLQNGGQCRTCGARRGQSFTAYPHRVRMMCCSCLQMCCSRISPTRPRGTLQ